MNLIDVAQYNYAAIKACIKLLRHFSRMLLAVHVTYNRRKTWAILLRKNLRKILGKSICAIYCSSFLPVYHWLKFQTAS